MKPVLKEDFGATIYFGRVFMKPGYACTECILIVLPFVAV